MPHYDVIVVGAAGGVGSAALFTAARRGLSVLGLDQFRPGHDRGSSHGQTRIIREAYFEHPDYVPLVRRASAMWQELEFLRGEQLLLPTGLIEIGPEHGEVVSGVTASARQHDIAIECLTAAEAQSRFAGFRIPETYSAVFEPTAGCLRVEQCVIAHADEAVKRGAELQTGQVVIDWRAEGTGVLVTTEHGMYSGGRLIVAAGAWAPQLLRDLGIPLVVRRKPLYWYEPADETYHIDRGCPAFLYELPEGIFYGLPQIDALGVKLAEHTGGQLVSDPSSIDRYLDAGDEARVAGFAGNYLPRLTRRLLSHATCMYTLTADQHFIVDRHPVYQQVALAAGLSGHGFKFTPVLGEALVDLAMDGNTKLPVEFLSAARRTLSASD
jgi:sarcosine oxidase